jgi:long-chain fatty acid transport protein
VKKLSAVLLLAASTASAGGLARTNGISARGTGMGGAWAAWADDASAVYFNPAAMDAADSEVDVGGEFVTAPRSYTPIDATGTSGAAQKTTISSPVPSLGVITHFNNGDDIPSRVTFGAGIWNTFGGSVSYKPTGNPAIDASEDVALEANAGLSLRVSDRLALGATFRLGLGLFSTDATMNPFDAHLSANGLGVGAGVGALFRPTQDVRIGVAWRSPMHITTEGNGTVNFTGTPAPQQVRHTQNWPQTASLGIGWRAAPAVKLAAQVDWAQWSQLQQIVVEFPASPGNNQTYREDWKDTWTVRAGGEYSLGTVAVRAGAYVDTSAVPDRSIERQYYDLQKYGVSAGAGTAISGWRIDAAVDWVLPGTRTVPNNDVQTTAFPADRNIAPGTYKGTMVTAEVAVGHAF